MPRAPKNYLRGNPKLPWEEFEVQVKNALASSRGPFYFHVEGKRTLKAGDAEYEVDGYAEVKVFGGAVIKVIIECKRHKKAATRDMVLALHKKTEKLGAHKAMMFSTSGFQKAALEYAKDNGIALVKVAKRRRTSYVPPDDATYVAGDSVITYMMGRMGAPAPIETKIRELFFKSEEPPELEEPPKFEPPVLALNDDSTYVGVLVSASDASMTLQDWLTAD